MSVECAFEIAVLGLGFGIVALLLGLALYSEKVMRDAEDAPGPMDAQVSYEPPENPKHGSFWWAYEPETKNVTLYQYDAIAKYWGRVEPPF